MAKIKIMTDSASDIPAEFEAQYDIKILNFPITMGEESFREREKYTNDEFFEKMASSDDFPTTSQITTFEFVEQYKAFYEEGYSDLIFIPISSTGSNTCNSANMAIEDFYNEVPEAREAIKIHIVDSLNYTSAYGYAVIQAAAKAQKGASVEEIIAYLKDWFSSCELHFASYTLKFVRRSGRLSAAAAFAGELLGLRPLINVIDGKSGVSAKVRGDKNIIPALLNVMSERIIPQTPYVVLRGIHPEYAEEFVKEATKRFGYPPEYVCPIGGAVAANAGPDVVGVSFKGKKHK